jgi:hypothetical protein
VWQENHRNWRVVVGVAAVSGSHPNRIDGLVAWVRAIKNLKGFSREAENARK